MRIITAEHMGMCFGVRDALARAHAIAQPTQVTIFGQLVHNPVVNRQLAARGFDLAGEAQPHTPGPNGASNHRHTVLITAHGISNHQRTALETAGKTLIDTTCPLVKKAHAAALSLAADGHFVIVAGKKNHVEIRGLTGDLFPGHFAIVESPADVTHYPAHKIGVISQTTLQQRDLTAIVEKIRTENPNADLRCINTICQPTRDRQAALEQLLPQIDTLLVVGGRHSNNTRQLAARAAQTGVRVIHIEDAAELSPELFANTRTLGLTAGTSTLPETIAAVHQVLTSYTAAKTIVERSAFDARH